MNMTSVAPNTAPAVPKKHPVDLIVKGTWVIAQPDTLNVWKGDTLQIGCGDGTFRVEFHPWPFKEPEQAEVRNNHGTLTFWKSGPFDGKCFVTRAGSTEELTYSDGGIHGNVGP